jgi:hypothetical protein
MNGFESEMNGFESEMNGFESEMKQEKTGSDFGPDAINHMVTLLMKDELPLMRGTKEQKRRKHVQLQQHLTFLVTIFSIFFSFYCNRKGKKGRNWIDFCVLLCHFNASPWKTGGRPVWKAGVEGGCERREWEWETTSSFSPVYAFISPLFQSFLSSF